MVTKVLIVDDNVLMVEAIKRLLKAYGFVVSNKPNPQTSWEDIKAHHEKMKQLQRQSCCKQHDYRMFEKKNKRKNFKKIRK